MAGREGPGPTRVRDGALVRVTPPGDRDLCWLHGCERVPVAIIAFYGRWVWVCGWDRGLDGVGPGPAVSWLA